MDKIETILKSAKNIVIISGAGLSKASGIPTFRDEGGTWDTIDPSSVAFANSDIGTISAFFQSRYHGLSGIKPNAAHYACSELEVIRNVVHITQNVDGLLSAAGCVNTIEVHGTIKKWYCIECDHDVDPEQGFVCTHCGSDKTRPKIVLFGETLDTDALEYSVGKIKNADLVFSIGTSGVVQPVSLLTSLCIPNNIPVIAINPSAPENYFSIWIEGTAEDILPKIVNDLK